jgi:hypothetical protein
MKGDFTRDTFDPTKHFRRILMQQGRVQLDADWNEQASILLHYLQTLAADLIGSYAGPEDYFGFEIQTDGEMLTIGPGRYYVDGILCENECECNFFDQPDPYFSEADTKQLWTDLFSKGDPVGVYLDVWERHLTFLDDELIRETALGINGPDTATRAKVVWQVKMIPTDSCDNLESDLFKLHASRSTGRMKAQLDPATVEPDPCIISPESKYRGIENQLYRVEIHDGSFDENNKEQPWTFKWSANNGSTLAAWLDTNDENGLVVSSTRGFEAEKWVEVTSETDELANKPGQMFKIVKVEGDVIYLKDKDVPEWQKGTLLKIRQWDQVEAGDTILLNGVVEGEADKWLDLEGGIQVQFEEGKNYCSGDYWLIPARVATGDIEWPFELDENGQGTPLKKPKGIWHHYAPLAILTFSGGKFGSPPTDCRCKIPKLQACPSMGE